MTGLLAAVAGAAVGVRRASRGARVAPGPGACRVVACLAARVTASAHSGGGDVRGRGGGGRSRSPRPSWCGWSPGGRSPALIVAVTVVGPAGDPARRRRTAAAAIDRVEAVEEWTRRLSDVLVVGVGLEQAIAATVRTCPAP